MSFYTRWPFESTTYIVCYNLSYSSPSKNNDQQGKLLDKMNKIFIVVLDYFFQYQYYALVSLLNDDIIFVLAKTT